MVHLIRVVRTDWAEFQDAVEDYFNNQNNLIISAAIFPPREKIDEKSGHVIMTYEAHLIISGVSKIARIGG